MCDFDRYKVMKAKRMVSATDLGTFPSRGENLASKLMLALSVVLSYSAFPSLSHIYYTLLMVKYNMGHCRSGRLDL